MSVANEIINDTSLMHKNVINRPTKWTKEHESLMIDWADKAMCYRWLHSKSNECYHRLNTWFTIPVIVMSTLTGTANFAQEKFPETTKQYVPMLIGGVNIIAGIITTVQQFLKIGELNEAHRVASLSWDKFYRKIRIELAKAPDERLGISDFLKTCTEEFDRLMEISPNIDEKIIKEFYRTFQGKLKTDKRGDPILNEKQLLFKNLKKPEICDSLETTANCVYKAPAIQLTELNIENKLSDVIKEKEKSLAQVKIIEKFCKEFNQKYMREPTEDEIIQNLSIETDEISQTNVEDYIKKKVNLDINREKDNNMGKDMDNVVISITPP